MKKYMVPSLYVLMISFACSAFAAEPTPAARR